MMAEIYRSATDVLVWLGEGDSGIEVALWMMCATKITGLSPREFAERKLGLRPSDIRALKEAIARISTLPYWDRVWIKQELILNQNVRFLYGEYQIKNLDEFLCGCNGSDWCSDHDHGYAAGPVPCTNILSFCPWYPGSFHTYPLVRSGDSLFRLCLLGSPRSSLRTIVYG